MQDAPNSWERATLNKILMSGIKEQRAARRWGIFFKFLFFAYLIAITAISMLQRPDYLALLKQKPFIAVVDVKGTIMDGKMASASQLLPAIRNAFANEFSKGVILRVNSPGGSPIQSNLVYNEIKRQKSKYPDKKIIAVVEDMGASGAYWIACGADEIYADKSSIIGSIGVVVSSFGFTGLMEQHGIERRLYTAGDNKGMLDPFSPEVPKQVELLEEQLAGLHDMFIATVKEGRGDKLADVDDIFSGRFWMGYQSKELGLIDGFGDVHNVAKDVLGVEDVVDFSPKANPFGKFAASVSEAFADIFTTFKISLH